MPRPKIGDVFCTFDDDIDSFRTVRVLSIKDAGPAWFEMEVKDLIRRRKITLTMHQDTIFIIRKGKEYNDRTRYEA